MATSNNGIDMLVYVGTTAVAGQTGASLSLSRDSSDYSSKGVEFKTTVLGSYGWSISCDSLFLLPDATDTSGWSALYDAFIAGTALTVKFKIIDAKNDTDEDAVNGYTGTAYITSLSVDASFGEGSTGSIEFQGSGALSEIVVVGN
jgi:predicted secreted protein